MGIVRVTHIYIAVGYEAVDIFDDAAYMQPFPCVEFSSTPLGFGRLPFSLYIGTQFCW